MPRSKDKSIKPASRPKQIPTTKAPSPSTVHFVCRTIATYILAAASAQLTQLALSPVYGSLPSTQIRSWTTPLLWSSAKITIAVPGLWIMPLAILMRVCCNKHQQAMMRELLPAFGMCLPAVLSETFRFSGTIGPTWGPLLVGFCTTSPLILLSLLTVVDDVVRKLGDDFGMRGVLTVDLPLVVGCYVIMDRLQDVTGGYLTSLIVTYSGANPILSRFGLLTIVTLCYAPLGRSRKGLVVVGGLAVLHLVLFNPHLPLVYNTSRLNASLQSEGYSLVARQESFTGYISVLENIKDHFRVMRCDHSLLGGEWTNKPVGHPAILNEPIYSIFIMLEAVRLVETESFKSTRQVADKVDSALVIGLGVGTAPAALVAHGINVTTVEIDPAVHNFASEYFDLQQNHISIIGDAVEVVEDLQGEKWRYDYIIHDVFTGGAEPIELFTQEFLTGLISLLAPDGVIAINYAGDLLLSSAISVIQTVKSVFPICRSFRETPQAEPLGAEDYTNIVMFCRISTEPFTFRDPIEADFLGSPARRQHLYPRNEVRESFQEKGQVLTRGHTAAFEASQMKSAIGHWHVMRTVLPAKVWETW